VGGTGTIELAVSTGTAWFGSHMRLRLTGLAQESAPGIGKILALVVHSLRANLQHSLHVSTGGGTRRRAYITLAREMEVAVEICGGATAHANRGVFLSRAYLTAQFRPLP